MTTIVVTGSKKPSKVPQKATPEERSCEMPGNAPLRNIYIKDLVAKLEFLRLDDDASRIAKHDQSVAGFARAVGMKRQTLYTWNNPETCPKKEIKLTTTQNQNISEKLDFSANWFPWTDEPIDKFKTAWADRMSDRVKTISNPLITAKRFLERLQLQGVEIKADVDFAKGHVPVAACEVVFEALPVQVSQTEDGGTLQPALRPRSTISKTRLGTGESHLASVKFSWKALNNWAPPLALNVDVGLPAVWFLDGPLHIERCLLVVTFSDVGHTVPAGEQRQFPASPRCEIEPQENARKCDLVIKPVGFDAQQFHWEISMRAGPIGVFTARDLVQITEVGIGDTLKVMIVVTAKDFKLGDVDGE